MVGRVVVHIGLHKTGTTSLQATIRANAKHLWPYMGLGLRARLKPLRSAATAWSAAKTGFGLDTFRMEARALLGGYGLDGQRGLLISEEDLCGLMPGRSGVSDYRAAKTLVPVFRDAIRARWPGADTCFVVNTRPAEPWLRSLYWHSLHSSRLTQPFDTFAQGLARAAEHAEFMDGLQMILGETPLIVRPITDVDQRLGMAEELFEMMGVPEEVRAAMTPVRPENLGGQPDSVAQMLELNRSALSASALHVEKAKVMSAHKAYVRRHLGLSPAPKG